MNGSHPPDMSVVLVTPDRFDTIRKTVQHLRTQTVRDQLEIVIVAPSAKGLNLDESHLKEFCQFHLVEVGEIKSTGKAIVNSSDLQAKYFTLLLFRDIEIMIRPITATPHRPVILEHTPSLN